MLILVHPVYHRHSVVWRRQMAEVRQVESSDIAHLILKVPYLHLL